MKKLVRKILNSIGLDIRRLNSPYHDQGQLNRLLNHNKIDLILDIGANKGQFALERLMHNKHAKIISFEPLIDAHDTLRKISRKYQNWTVFERCALGSFSHTSKMNVASNSVSSSILEVNAIHVEAEAKSSTLEVIPVKVETLDWITEHLDLQSQYNVLLKIDTQGFELEVLKGAENSMRNIKMVILEMSTRKLYGDQPLWSEINTYLNDRGFSLIGINKGFVDPVTGNGLQFDGIYLKDD